MRFRSKFVWMQSLTSIMWFAIGVASIVKYARSGADQFHLVMGIAQVLLGILCFSLYVFCWWEIGDAGVTERRAWTTLAVPWSDIVRVGPWQSGKKPIYGWVEIDYARNGPMSNRGTMRLQPADCSEFLSALRAHATHAEFDPFPSKV